MFNFSALVQNKHPSISVCIPLFNGRDYVLECLGSLESEHNLISEILISDDGSRDSSLKKVEHFLRKSRINAKIFKNSGPKGIVGNCNFLATKAKGDFLKFLFQDDLIDKNFLSEMILPLQNEKNISMIFCDRRLKLESNSNACLQIFDGCSDLSSKWSKLEFIQDGIDLFEDPLLLEGPINKIGEPSNTLISKKHFEEVGGFTEGYKQLLDLELWFKLFAVGKIAYIDKKLSTFRVHPFQESQNNFYKDLISKETIQIYMGLLTNPLYSKISSDAKSRVCQKLISASISDKVEVEVFNKKIFDLNETIDEKESELKSKNQRISFIEGTLVWKFRRSYMKLYYLYKKLFERSGNIIKPPNLFNFKHFKGLCFPRFKNVKFTIIICYYNKFEETFLCLESILKNITNINYEIILVDDHSDENNDFLSCIQNIKIIRNQINLGFLKSCNIGASYASGEFLVFLNNDTQVDQDWLKSCFSLLNKKNIGAIGSKLLYPDGKLQEAGGIIWNDATGCNYGKGYNPILPEYNYVREVDYCSGASLITPKTVFDKIGGLADEFEPAYYEDTDYCFRLKASGFKVFYQPNSVVYHYEGLSCGTNLNEGVKKHQLKNSYIFRENGSRNYLII